MIKIELTPGEINNLIEFLEIGFVPFVRKCEGIDNMGYLASMCDVYKRLVEKSESRREFAERLEKEMKDALASNYVDSVDEFVAYYDGKIAVLRGMLDFIKEWEVNK